MEIGIRKPDYNDVPAIAALHITAWRQAYAGIIPQQVLDELSVDESINRWQERIEKPKSTEQLLIVVNNDDVLGFAMFGESREAMNLPQAYGEIYALYVHPNHWRKGAGKALIHNAFKWFDENHFPGVYLWTLKENRQARSFYENAGMFLVPQERYINTHGVELLCCCYCNIAKL
jgi:GNAT superfamily N-acetyltransferase